MFQILNIHLRYVPEQPQAMEKGHTGRVARKSWAGQGLFSEHVGIKSTGITPQHRGVYGPTVR